jgi:hypothetical protein
MALGLSGSLVAAGVLVACYAAVIALQPRSRGRHREGRVAALAEPAAEVVAA